MDFMDLFLKLVIQHNIMGIWIVMQITFYCVLKLIIYDIIILKDYRPNLDIFLFWYFLRH